MKKKMMLWVGIVLTAGMLGACGSGEQIDIQTEENSAVVQEQ